MKRFYIFAALFLLLGGVFSVYAQDLIILKDGNTIEAKVIEISPTEIRYKRFDHLDGPTIVVLAAEVLSIRYENGRTEIINAITQPSTVQTLNQPIRNPRFNTLGVTIGYLGVSNFGFSLKGTVSPAKYTFFDFNLGLGFSDFSFNGNINFNGFVPFNKGGWYGGLGLGGGVYESGDSMNGFFAINAITGFLFFNWLNISAALQMEVAPEFNFRIIPMVGYVYRFKSQEETSVSQREPKEKKPPRELVAHHWISIEPDFSLGVDRLKGIGLGIGVRYQYQVSPRFAFGGSIHYRELFNGYEDSTDYIESESEKDLNIVANFSIVANGYWYPSSRFFYLKLGLGWYYCHIRNDYYYYDSYVFNGLSIIPGSGWTIDIGKPGGFFLSTGLDLPIVIGKSRTSSVIIADGFGNKVDKVDYVGLNIGIKVFFGVGYAF